MSNSMLEHGCGDQDVAAAMVRRRATRAEAAAQSLSGQPVTRIFEFVLAPENIGSFIAAGRENILTSLREEPGVLSICVAADKEEPTRLYVIEAYRDEAACQAHRETGHFKAFVKAIDGKFISRRVIETNPSILAAKSFSWSET